MSAEPELGPPITAVIFDFGGVISDDPFSFMAAYAADNGFEPAEFAAIGIGYGSYGNGDHPWHQLERGEIDVAAYEQATTALAKSRGHEGFPPLPVDRILNSALGLRPAMMQLISNLRAKGIATAILTNNVRALGAWRDSADWNQLVDAVIDSCQVGMRKPEPRIFEHTCAALGVKINQAAFLDDMQANVDVAADLGMTAIRVTNPDEAIETVRQLVGS